MKKILGVLVLLAACVCGLSAQSLNADAYGVDMVMPDGVTATIAFYKKWGTANEDIKAVQPKDKKAMIGTTLAKAKTESDIGYFRKTYKETDSEDIADICNAMKSCGAMYGVAWVDYGNRVTRCVFTYKGVKLTYDRMDFFDETNGAYAEFVAKENAKKERAEKIVGDITKTVMGGVSNAVVANIKAEEENQKKQAELAKKQQTQTTTTKKTETTVTVSQDPNADHNRNKADLKRFFEDKRNALVSHAGNATVASMIRRVCDSGINPAELERYEFLLNHNYSKKDAADVVFDEFRRNSLPESAR